MREKIVFTSLILLAFLMFSHPLVNATSITIGEVRLEPEFPERGEILKVFVPINLEGPEEINVQVYLDGKLIRSNELNISSTLYTFEFTIDTQSYEFGTHSLEIKVKSNSSEDSLRRTFDVEPASYTPTPEHCISVERLWVENELKPGSRIKVNAEILNCGSEDVIKAKARLYVFSKTYYTGYFSIPSQSSKDILITLKIPEYASGKENFKLTVWDNFTSDTYSKEFIIKSGIPYIQIEKEYRVEKCKPRNISFSVTNTESKKETFFITISGKASEWFDNAPTKVTLNPDETKKITARVLVPSEVKEGYYKFNLKVSNDKENFVYSSLHVVKSFVLPMVSFAWGIFVILIVIIILLAVKYFDLFEERHTPEMIRWKNHLKMQ